MASEVRSRLGAKEDEVVIFSGIEWPGRAERQAVRGRMDEIAKTDERIDPERNPIPFDGKRMFYGRFKPSSN